VAFARVGRRVILADCDLRHPRQHELFGVSNDGGVSEFLRDPQARLPLVATSLPCLQLMTAGAPAEVPSDLIASPQMAEMVARLAEEADIVLFDAPPVLLASDAVELATHVDGVLLSITAGRTKRDEAQRAKELLERAGARIVGATLTNVAPGKLQNL
jgi:non-specific protein-tyrosine kinase